MSPSNVIPTSHRGYGDGEVKSHERSDSGTPRSSVTYLEPATPNCGRLQRFSSVEEALEGGFCRNYLSDECSGPSPRKQKAWEQCSLIVDDAKRFFRMHVSGKSQRFLLSAWCDAKRNRFYISQYQDFPEEADVRADAREAHHCCILNRVGDTPNYELWSRGCTFCDQVLSKNACESSISAASPKMLSRKKSFVAQILQKRSDEEPDTGDPPPTAAAATSAAPSKFSYSSSASSRRNDTVERRLGRQLLAEITQTSVLIQCGRDSKDTVSSRCLRIFVPALTDPEEEKPIPCGWCARQTRKSVPSVRIENKFPKWNNALGSLSLKFVNNRVRAASKKNFICTAERMPSRDDCILAAATSPKRRDTIEREQRERRMSASGSMSEADVSSKTRFASAVDPLAELGCLQIGKVRKGKFNVDFRFPVSPVQALAAALTTFNWVAKDKKSR